MRIAMSLSAEYRKAIIEAVAQQVIAMLWAGLILDGGQIAAWVLVGVAAHWTMILAVVLRRPSNPTRFDVGLVRFGFIPACVVVILLAILLGWLGLVK